jgi:hypothetical protein
VLNYYAEEMTAIPFGLLKRMFAQFLPRPVAWGLAAYFRMRGLLRWTPRPTYGIGGVGSAREVPKDQLPSSAISMWAPILEQLTDLGFRHLSYRVGDDIGKKESACAMLLDPTQSVFAIVEWVCVEGVDDQCPIEFDSYFEDDPDVMTGAMPEQNLALADAFDLDFVDTIRIERLYKRHLRRIGQRRPLCFAAETAVAENDDRSRRRFDAMVKKRMLRELKPREIERILQGR